MDDDEETLCRFGTPLPTYEENEIPSKKPVSVEDQIVLDVNGKRRFHGAFTGGFSAGYWNTVGSEEGWKPAEFKSSRKEKAASRSQNPMDFMDDEDLGEFGIAPQRVQTKEDFAHSSKTTKRRLVQSNSSGPIPGTPVLKTLLEPAKEKTAVRMLKNMGWREGQGIGERQSKVEKRKAKNRNNKELYVMKMYGCELPAGGNQNATEANSDSESDSSDYEVTFAPDDFDPLLAAIKDNTFGLGYSGLERGPVGFQRFNLFDTLEIVDRNNKKLSIRGQAFGVGALEDDDDEDVYAKDDMSRYDFSLEDKSKAPAAIKSSEHANCLEGFCPSKKVVKGMKKVFRVNLPGNFIPRNWLQRRTRFEPLDEAKEKQFLESNRYKLQGLGRHDLDPEKRAHALGEKPLDRSKDTKNSILDIINKRQDSFVAGEVINTGESSSSQASADGQNQTAVKKDPLKFDIKFATGNLGSTKEGFKPFIADPDKQERYDKFVAFSPTDKFKSKEEFLNSLQPLGMSSWDREREFKEFAQAQRMYRPLDGLMSDRFVTESSLIAEKETVDPTKSMDIKMKRVRSMWKPNKDLCKRFNVPEPFGGMLEEEKTKPKNKFSVFDYLEAPVNSRADFVTPVVVPKRSTKDEKSTESVPVRVSAKDFFAGADKPSTSHEDRSSTSSVAVPKPQVQITGSKKPEKRSDLEQKVLESVNMKPEEKKDLFKSIFCSSDEDEEADPKLPEAIRTNSASAMNETDKIKLVESLVAIKPASEMNVLRNNSPPRGIFKSILEIKRTEPVAVESEDSSSSSEDDEFYGPKLPSQTANGIAPASSSTTATTQNELDARLTAMIAKTGSHSIVEEWVEKDKTSSRKSKKKKLKEHKKSKKHKKEKKKHKHKDRR